MFLTLLFVVSLLISNIITSKQVLLPFNITMTGAVFIFPITYILSDVFSEVYGYKWSRITCYLAFLFNLFMVLVFSAVIKTPAPSYWTNQEAFQTVLGNTPRILASSLLAFVVGDLVNDKIFKNICAVFAASGSAFTLPEEKMNDIIAVTSSSPAYVFLFIKSIYDAAVEMGFENKDMLEIICKMVIGSTELLMKTGKTPDELISMVKSPKGTTEQALNVFEANNFSEIVKNAMIKCSERAEELSKGM